MQAAHHIFFYDVSDKMKKTRIVFASEEIMELVIQYYCKVSILNIESLIKKFQTASGDMLAASLSAQLVQGIAFSHIQERVYARELIYMQPDGKGERSVPLHLLSTSKCGGQRAAMYSDRVSNSGCDSCNSASLQFVATMRGAVM